MKNFSAGAKRWAIAGGVSAVASAGLLFALQHAKSEQTRLTNHLVKTEQTIKEERAKVRQQDSAGFQPELARGEVMNRLTQLIARAAEQTGVTLSQLQMDGNPVPLSTKPSGDGKSGAWSLNTVSFSIIGTTPQVFLTVKKLAALKEPYEFKELGFNRLVNPGSDVQGVTANVKLSILVPAEGNS